MHPFEKFKSSPRALVLALSVSAAIACAGCQSPMYSGAPEEEFSRSPAPDYAPDTYEPPYQVGRQSDQQANEEDGEPPAQTEAEQKYQYRGGRDPVTGRAETQM